jgi:hypothetical protein
MIWKIGKRSRTGRRRATPEKVSTVHHRHHLFLQTVSHS